MERPLDTSDVAGMDTNGYLQDSGASSVDSRSWPCWKELPAIGDTMESSLKAGEDQPD